MLSYPIDEAEELLTTKLSAAKQSLANCEEDLDFLREQITVRSFWRDLRHKGGADISLDDGGCNGKSLQLGCHDEEEREERARGAERYWK